MLSNIMPQYNYVSNIIIIIKYHYDIIMYWNDIFLNYNGFLDYIIYTYTK